MTTTPIYRALVTEIERRRIAIGLSMERVSELMGAADRSYSKMIYADTPSGRVAQWPTLQAAISVLFADGFSLAIEPKAGDAMTSEGARRRIKAEAARWNASTARQHMTTLSALGVRARRERLTAEQRSEACRVAARARWARIDEATRGEIMAGVRARQTRNLARA